MTKRKAPSAPSPSSSTAPSTPTPTPPRPRPSSALSSTSSSSSSRSRSSSSSSTLSPMPPTPAPSSSGTRTLSEFRFSKGHGAHAGERGPKRGKTEIRPSAVTSVNELRNRSRSLDGGTTKFGGGDVQVSLVPRRSDPTQFRAIGTKTGGGGTDGPTSFPIDPANVPASALKRTGVRASQVVNEPDSPRRKGTP
ncbi:hypothetical protein LMG29739_03389 [Paraburkholderia solisilvae]|uniref:Uncharacterized protein n=1 Tax=Paraburkholderia solisilvae TaxID=624376 RepID=A0A6J5E1X7_9BURK|nr:hypothetical protein LMG29739_03389 [Paraburkholderia solisilvae]